MATFEIKPEWRTPTVLQLCRAMRETDDYTAMPILADAMQDADCNDAALLARLREGPKDRLGNVTLVAVVMSDDAAAAVAWIDELTEKLGHNYGYDEDAVYDPETDDYVRPESAQPNDLMNYETIMGWAKDYLETGDRKTQYGAENWRDTFPGYAERFWECYRLITNEPADKVNDPYGYEKEPGSFFSCSC